MASLESQILTVGVEHNPSLREKLEELASVVDRLDARQALRQEREAAPVEMGIYESCVSGLPDFSKVNGDLVDCPACESHRPRHEAAQLVPPWIRAEVDWRRQHTEVLNQRIEVLEREKSLWEQKLRKLRSNSPGTSAKNKIFQMFPKDPPVALPTEDSTAPRTAHAWSVGPAALKGTAREVYEKMLNPQPLQFITPPKRERQRLQEERAVEAEQAQQDALRAQEERLQQELGQHLTDRQELRSASQRELQAMRCLEAERQRQRDVLRATLQDELHQHLREERRAWHVEQERQAAQRRAAERRRLEVHQEMQRLELARLVDKLSLQRSVHPLEPHFDQEKLLELWKLRLAKDPSLRSGEAPEGKELLEVTGIPAELLGIEEWLLFYGDLLNGTSRDKVVDIDVLEQAFLMVSGGQNFLQANFLHEAANSLATPGVMKMMLSYWLQHLQATSSMPAGECDSVLGTLPLESAPVQEPYDELTTAMPSQGSIPKDHMDGRSFKNAADSTMVATELDAKIPQQRTSVADAFRFSQSLVAGDMGPPVDEARTSLASRASVQRQDDDTWEAASQNGHHASTSSLLARNVSDPGSQTAKKISTSWQQTRTSLGSSLPMQRNADDVGVSPAKNEGDSKALAKDVQDSLEHQTASATSGGDVQKARESQASVPQDHKEQASMLTKSLYARYADISAPVAAQDMQDSPEHQTDSATSGGDVQKARESQASVPQDHKEQASMLTKSLYARYADSSQPVAATDVQDSPEHQPASATSRGDVQKARESQASVPQDHKEQASMLTKSLYARYADSSAPVAAQDVQDSPEHQTASATSGGDVHQETQLEHGVAADSAELEAGDGEASEEEVFTKEQWVAWFMTAQLEQEELELLNAALQPMAAQQHLSPEELAEALRSHAAKMSEEDRDQLEEWAQWALDIDADD